MLTCAEISFAITYHVVNGWLDLVNLFPVKLDLKPFIDAWGNAVTFRLSALDGSLHFCGVDDEAVAAPSFLYYLNPTPLDRNLEWDMKNNLCPNPGMVGRQP